jgi:zinc protease
MSLAAGSELVHANSTFLTRHAAAGLSLVADLLEDPGYRAQDLEVIRQLALNDLEAREDDLDDLVDEMFFQAVADGHPYSKLPHGTREGIEAITRDDLLGFHAEAYRPDHAHVALVGDFDEDEVDRLLADRFGRLPRPAVARPSTPALGMAPVARTHVLTRTDKAQAKIVLGGPGLAAADPDRLAAIALNQILGGSSIRSRLGDEIRDRLGLAYSVSSRNYERSAGGFFLVHLGTRPENVELAVDSIRAELRRLLEGVTDTELQEAKDYLSGSFPLRFTTYGRLARYWTRAGFYEWPEDTLDTYVDRVKALTGEDLIRVARRLVDAAGTLAVAGPVDRSLKPARAAGNDA